MALVIKMSKLRLSEGLEVENLGDIQSQQLVTDIRIIDSFWGSASQMNFMCPAESLGPDMGKTWFENTPFSSIVKIAGTFDARQFPWPNPPWHTPPNDDQIANMQSRIDGFLAGVVKGQENASHLLLDALSDAQLSLGNMKSQWTKELRGRAATGGLLRS